MPRILVIDDEANIRMTVRMALEQKKYTVDVAADAREGLEKFANGEKWDLVLLDQRMPGMQGLEVLLEIMNRSPFQRVVMISAYGVYDLVHEAMEAGAVDFLRKPFTVETLRNVVKSALDRQQTPGEPTEPSPTGAIFQTPIVDGMRIESTMGEGLRSGSATLFDFLVRRPDGDARVVTVYLPDYVIELVKAYVDQDQIPGGTRFWQAFCEEAIAQHLWKLVEIPPDGYLRITELTDDLQRWVSSTLRALTEYKYAKR